MPARCRAAVAVTAVESIPPLRKQPSGTSLAMRSRTASSRRRAISLRQVTTSTVASGAVGMSQYGRVGGKGRHVAGRQLGHAPDPRVGSGNEVVGEIAGDRLRIELAADRGVAQ